jgi:serine/threonine protein phosphatase PrpC
MSKFKAFNLTEIGASHIKEAKVCQDDSLSFEEKGYAVAIVCDGHGSNKYFRSDRGSSMAAEVTMSAIQELMKSRTIKNEQGSKLIDALFANPDKFMQQLAANIIYRWREHIAEDYQREPFSETELALLSPKELAASQKEDGWVSAYGTTLIAAVRANNFWFGLHIGDGKCVTVNTDGTTTQPIPWDEKCFLNVTTSLSDAQALSSFRSVFSTKNLPSAIFVGTDGVDDTFGNDEALESFYKTVVQLFNEKDFAEAQAELKTYLPKLSEKGSRDDVSIAGILISKK